MVGNTQRGFSLIELVVATFIVGVGTLAVVTMVVYWHSSLEHLTQRMDALDALHESRPQPVIARRYEVLSCEADKDIKAGLIIEY